MTGDDRARRSTAGLLTAALLTAGLLTGCTGPPATDPPPPVTAGGDPVAWMDRVCGAVLAFATPATTAPDFTATADLAAVGLTTSAYLGSVVDGAAQGRAQLDGIGPSPVPGGDEVVERARASMALLVEKLTGARSTVDAADPADPAAFLAALDQAETALDATVVPDVLGDLDATPLLARAAERAAQCQQVSALSGAAPR